MWTYSELGLSSYLFESLLRVNILGKQKSDISTTIPISQCVTPNDPRHSGFLYKDGYIL